MADHDFLAPVVAAGLGWTEDTMEAVMDAFPYADHQRVTMRTWVSTVAQVAHGKAEDPATTAERLALYAKTYAERYATELPHPTTITRSDP